MTAENDFKSMTAQTQRSQPSPEAQPSPNGEQGEERTPGAQAQRDAEIEQIQQHSRHQRVGIQKPPDVPPAPPRKALMFVGVFLLLLLIAGGITLWDHLTHSRALAKETERETVPTVAVVYPQSEKPDEELVLPGSLQAYEESPIYARTSGYLVRWYKDIGSKVAKISADRWENLRKSDSVSAQEADQQASGYKQAQANLAAADANVRRLEQLEGFKDVYAPFSGVLTRRNVDPGALINAGAGAAGRELFDIARVDPLRVFTSVPQAYAPSIRVGY